ncbi:MAG: hypothetical protein H0X71_07890, partial [Rubrobacter sp.]|nr:hypothetical protein [Rubrobacter sp.]
AILKQGERSPMPVEEQVAMIYAATQGMLSDVETENVPDYEAQLRDYLRDSHGELLEDIRDSRELSDETAEKLEDAIESFNENYEPSESGVSVSIGAGDEDESDDSDSENGSGSES